MSSMKGSFTILLNFCRFNKERWMAVERSDFYEKVESLVSPDKTENGLYFNDIAAFWMPRVGLRCGEVLRFVRKTSAKSAVPVFEWKKEKK